MSEPARKPFEHRPNSGSLFKNQFKREESNPDFRGDGSVECPCCLRSFNLRFSAWIKKSNSGKADWFSLKFTPSDAAAAAAPKAHGWRPGAPAAMPATRPSAPKSSQPTSPAPSEPEADGFADNGEDDVPF